VSQELVGSLARPFKAQIGEPVPGEDALDGNDEIVAERATAPRNAAGRLQRFFWSRIRPSRSRRHRYMVLA